MANPSLIVKIGSDLSELEKGLSRAARAIEDTGKKMQTMGKSLSRNITAPITALAGGVIALQKRTGEYADRVQDLSDVTGISTDALQEWDFVARRVGVSTDVISSAFSSLGRRMSQFSRGSGPAVDAADKLGVAFRDSNGQMRNADDLIMDLLGGLSQMPPDLERAELGTALFGRRWEMLAPVIGRGSEGIEQIRQEAQDLGLVMSGEALESANEFREAFVTFQERISSAGRAMAVDLMPVVLDLVPVFERVVERVTGVIRNFTQMDDAMQRNVVVVGTLVAAIGPALIVIGKLATAVSLLMTPLMAKVALLVALAGSINYVIRNWEALIERFQDISWWENSIIDMLRFLNDHSPFSVMIDSINSLLSYFGRATIPNPFDSVNEWLEGFEKNNDNFKHEFETFGEFMKGTASDIGNFIISALSLDGLFVSIETDDTNVNRTRQAVQGLNQDIRETAQIASRQLIPEDFGTAEMDIKVPDFRRPLGLLQNYNNQLQKARQNMMEATRPEDIQMYAQEIERLNARIDKLTNTSGDVDNLAQSFQVFGMIAGQALDRLLFTGERLSNVLKSIKRQLASRAIMTALQMALGGGPSGLGGFLRSVFVNDALITSGGDVVKFHPDDNILAMKDFSGLGGGSVSEMKRAFSEVLRQHTSTLGPDEVWVMNQRGAQLRGALG